MRLYKFLLHLYPAAFRAEYEDELCRVFRQNRRDANGILMFWLAEIVDLIRNAFAVHWDILRSDVRYATTTAYRRPGFALVAILVTALGIGANTAVFSVVNHVFIRPLPYQDSERIVRMHEKISTGTNELSPSDYRDWKARATSFQAMGAYTNTTLNLIGNGPPERVDVAVATADLLPLLGVQPLIGRWFTSEEDQYKATGVAIISFGLWRARFSENPRVLGERLRLDDETYSVIGVMPANFTFPDRNTQIWIPMRFEPEAFEDRNNTYLNVIAKRKSHVSLAAAIAEMAVITEKLEKEHPVENANTRAAVVRLRDGVSQQSRLLLGVLLGASLCVLLIACTNLANLFLVRAIGRRAELTVRAALGAGRERLVRQLITESLVFAFAGSLLGLIFAHGAVPILSRLIPTTLPIGDATVLDVRVLAFAAAALCITAVGFGVLPAMRISRGTVALRDATRSVMGDRKEGLRSTLVLAEITVTVILLICCGLLIRAFWKVQSIHPGFSSEHVWTMQTPLPRPKYDSTASRVDFYSRVLTEIRANPDISNASYISGLPMVMRGGIWAVLQPGGIDPNPGDQQTVSLRFVTPGFFDSLQIPLRMGRDIRESDTFDAPAVAVVSEAFVRRHFPGENPIGRQFHIAFQDRTIVGVAGDIRVRGLERNSEPQVYLSYKQVEDGGLSFYAPKALVIRTKGSRDSNVYDIARKIVQRIDPEMPVADVRRLTDILEEETSPRATQIRVIAAFAILSLLLAAIGIHGLLTFSVSQRIPEIGLRMALGAHSNDVLKIVLRQGLVVAGIGSILGLTLGYAAARALQALLAGIQPGDARAFGAAFGVAVLMTLSGCVLPAWRALRIDPAIVMRGE